MDEQGRPYVAKLKLSDEDLKGLLQNALVKVNQARQVLQLPPLLEMPTGVPNDELHCPLAHALHAHITASFATWEFGRDQAAMARLWEVQKMPKMDGLTLPLVLVQFVYHFDRKAFQALLITRCRKRHWESGDLD